MNESKFETNELRELEIASQILSGVIKICEGLNNNFGLYMALKLKQLVAREIQHIRSKTANAETMA